MMYKEFPTVEHRTAKNFKEHFAASERNDYKSENKLSDSTVLQF